jgi:hypothetical protein
VPNTCQPGLTLATRMALPKLWHSLHRMRRGSAVRRPGGTVALHARRGILQLSPWAVNLSRDFQFAWEDQWLHACL